MLKTGINQKRFAILATIVLVGAALSGCMNRETVTQNTPAKTIASKAVADLPNGSVAIRTGKDVLTSMLIVANVTDPSTDANLAAAIPRVLPQLPSSRSGASISDNSVYTYMALAGAVTSPWFTRDLPTTNVALGIFASGGIDLRAVNTTVTAASVAAVYNALAMRAYARTGTADELAAVELLRTDFLGSEPLMQNTANVAKVVAMFRAMAVGVLGSPQFIGLN